MEDHVMINAAGTGNPFPGLRPFEMDECSVFFGREGQSDELLERLRRTRFLAVVGTSGSGKSSLIRAGLLPALFGGLMGAAGSAWRIVVFRPGHDPIGNLARALGEEGVVPASDLRKVEPKKDQIPESDFIKDTDEAQFLETIVETTLRRSMLGLVEAAQQARMEADENLLIVVDQFEELFRFRHTREASLSPDDPATFVKLLIEASKQEHVPIYVVLTMRSDFLGDCSQFTGLPEAINQGQYLIPRMSRDERSAAITGPIAVGGGAITSRLVTRLLNDVGDNPDQLPILQHALMRSWDYCEAHRSNGLTLDLEDYENIGTMSEALSQHAEEACAELKTERSWFIAEKLFKLLTERGADNREIRRPTELAEICAVTEASEEEVIAVIDVFRGHGRSFLMPPAGVGLNSETVIDISHESLIRNWKRLRVWVNEEAQSAREYRRLADAAILHREGREGMLQDPALQLALDWYEKNKPNAAWARRYNPEFDTSVAYLKESKEARDDAIAERERQRNMELDRERREREQAEKFALAQARANRKLRLLMVALVILLLLAVGTAVYAMSQRRAAIERGNELAKALKIRDEADARRAEAEKGRQQALQNAIDERNRANKQAELAQLNEQKAILAQYEADKRTKVAELALEAKAKADAAAAKSSEAASKSANKETLNRTALEAFQRFEFRRAALMFQQLLDLSEDDSKSQAWAMYNLAAIQQKQGRYYNAEQSYGDVIARLKGAGADGREITAAMKGLAQVYHESRSYARAEKQYQELLGSAVDFPSEVVEDYLPLVAETQADLGDVYREQGKFVDAATYYKNAVETWGRSELDSLGLAERYKQIAKFYLEQEKYEDAETVYLRAYAIWKKTLVGGGLIFARDLEEIAAMYRSRKQFDKAEKYFKEALEVRDLGEQASGPSTETALRYKDYAEFYKQWGRPAEAKEFNDAADVVLAKALKNVAPLGVKVEAVETLLPESGVGYLTYNRGTNGESQYGRAATIQGIIKLGFEWAREHSIKFSVGHISKQGGGQMIPHQTHRNGTEFDIRPLRNDGQNLPVTISDAYYSPALTKELVLLIRQIFPGATIAFNDPVLINEKLTVFLAGQDNHIHVRLP